MPRAYTAYMRSSLTIFGAGALLALTACKKGEGETSRSGSGSVEAPAVQPKVELNGLRMPATEVAVTKSIGQTIEAMRVTSSDQRELHMRTGSWLTQESITRYEFAILDAVSRDIIGRPYVSQADKGRSLMRDLNAAGYHLYISQTVVEGEPYLGATLFTLGAPKHMFELQDVKRVMGMSGSSAKLRQLKEVCSTEHSDSLYGSIGTDGHIFIDPWLLMREPTAPERDLQTMFRSVLANELAHLKLQEARSRGVMPELEHQWDEAFSDFWTVAVTPPKQVLFTAIDVMSSAPLRYGESKLCAVEGIRAFGSKFVKGFNGAMDERSVALVIEYANDAENPSALPRLKQELLNAYRVRLVERGFPAAFFDVND